jgi:hypothetical protein
MNYLTLSTLFDQSFTVKLFKGQDPAFPLAFFHQVYKQQQRQSLDENEFLQRLDAYLEDLKQHHPEKAYQTPKDYLKLWSDEAHRLLRRVRRGDRYTIELTLEAERALNWVGELQPPPFIGTESRLMQIFSLLKEITENSSEDVERRLTQLEHEKAAIDRKIDQIIDSGMVDRYSSTQLEERLWNARKLAEELLSDFAGIEAKFRGIAKEIHSAHLQPQARKGAIVEQVLDAEEKLKDSPQGKSFYTFWQLIMSEERQDELKRLIVAIAEIPELAALMQDSPTLNRIIRYLTDAGQKIVESNMRLANQLRRLLDERNIAETRRVKALIDDIQRLALQWQDDPPDDKAFITLPSEAKARLLMEETRLFEPPIPLNLAQTALDLGSGELDGDYLQRFLPKFQVNEHELRQHIRDLLTQHESITLGAVVDHYPLTQGLAELVTYLLIGMKDPKADQDPTHRETVTYTDSEGYLRRYHLPTIRFYRERS